MKKLLSVIALAATAMLASCNLFIEDEQEDLTHGLDLNQKTVYKGDGWSEPKTETGEGYTITYQYFDNVKLLDDEIQKYIADIEVEDYYGCLGIINFREDTPEEMLPRIGEIVTIRPNDEFPYGFYAEVMAAGFEDGYYSIGTCAVDADKVFQKLEADVTSAAFQDAVEAQSRSHESTTRASSSTEGGFNIDEDEIDFVIDEESEDMLKGTFKIPIDARIPLDVVKLNSKSRKNKRTRGYVISNNDMETLTEWKASGSGDDGSIAGVHNIGGELEFKKEETKMVHHVTMNILGNCIDFKDDVQADGIAHIKGGMNCEQSFEITKSIKTPLKLGPLGLRIIFGGGLGLEAALFGTVNVDFSVNMSFGYKIPLTINPIDNIGVFLLRTADELAEGKSIREQFFDCKSVTAKVRNGNIEGRMSTTSLFKIGAGIGTKKLSLCVYGDVTTELIGTSFGATSILTLNRPDISDKPGLESTIKSNVGLQIGLTFNVYELIKGIQEDAVDIGSLSVKAYSFIVKKLKEKGLVDDTFPDDTESIQAVLEDIQKQIDLQDATVSKKLEGLPLDIPIPKIPIFKKTLYSFSEPWLPHIKNFSYKRTATTSEGATYYVSWGYSDKGILPSIGWGPFYPCVFVDGGKDDKATGTYYPDLDGYDQTSPIGEDTSIKYYGTGISIPNLQGGKSYTIYPALSTGRGKDAQFYDLAQVLTPSQPTVKIISTDHYASYQSESMKEYGYYGYLIEAKVAVSGAAKIQEWDVEFHLEKKDGTDLEYKKRIKGNDVKETKSHSLKIDLSYYKPEFETPMFGEYWIIESQPGEDLKTTWMEIKPYPIIGSWSEWNFSRTTGRFESETPMSADNEKVDEVLKANGDSYDAPIVFIDGELTNPVAVTENGVRKPLPPYRN